METFIVYDLDSKMPIAVGEQVSAETARSCASAATGIFHANLLAEEIDLEKTLPSSQITSLGCRSKKQCKDCEGPRDYTAINLARWYE
jgi:DNA-binding transcriptional regulator YdaS (Cro superfamily)